LEPGTAALRATVHGIKPGSGTLHCGLFNSAAGFPGRSPIVGGNVSAPATAESMPCDYESLPAGDYAISTYQDENSNGVLDTDAFGLPTEGYGATNNNLPALSAPSFDDSKVHVADGAIITADINLRN
jgi:uncharacterized protein (DUF2141 family)